MARVIQTVELPDGSLQDVEVDEAWSPEEIRTRLRAKLGLDGEAPAAEATVPKNTEEEDMPSFTEGEQPETAPRTTFGDRFQRQQELGLRAVTEGALAFPLMIGDAANSLLNFIPGVNLGSPTQIVSGKLTEAGLAEPETAGERVAGAIMQAGAGTAAGVKTAAKVTTGAVQRFMTEEAGTQLAAGTAAGAGIGVGNEADLGPVGLIMSGLAAGLGGAAGSKLATRGFAKWSEGRVTVDKPVTMDEVREQAVASKLPATDAELRNMQETLEELRTAQRADAEIAKMRPVASDPIEVKRAKAAAIRRMGGEGADKGNLPLETQRELARIQKREIERVEAKVRALEEQKAKQAPEAQEALALSNKLAADKAGSGAEVAVKGEGKPSLVATWGNDVISRIENVSPRLGMAVRRVSQRSATRTTDDIKRIDRFYRAPEYRALARADKRELDRAFLNGDKEAADLIMSKAPGLKELYDKNVRALLSDVQKQRLEGGADGFIESFHPRAVVRLKALKRSMGKEVDGEVTQALKDAARAKRKAGQGDLTENEVAAVINQRIGGRPLKVLKDRRITEITPEQQRYYADSRDSLIDYLHNHHSAVATRDFFKSSLGVERKLNQTLDEEALGTLLTRSMERGELTGDQLDELVPLLASQFGVSRQAVGSLQRRTKNLFTAGTLVNPLSTLTQFGDIAPLMRKFGVGETMKALFGKKALDVYDVGVRELSKDARTARGTARLVRDGLQAVGFDKLDKIMANTGVNAAFSRWTKLARKNPALARNKLSRAGFDDADAVLADLKAGRLTDDVKTLMLHDMGEIRPVAREDMPLHFQQHPNGRYLYSLLSWTLKQANFVRNSAIRDFRAGKKTKATTDFLKFLTLMGFSNGSVQTVKDWIRGEDPDLMDNFVTGALSIGMSGKFVVDALNRNKGLEALGAIIPFLGIMGNAVQKAFNSVVNMDPAPLLDAFPATRNFKTILESDIPAALLAVPLAVGSAMVPAAEAAFAVPEQRIPAGATPLAPEPVAAENDLPAGTFELPEPESLRGNVNPGEELQLRAAIEQELLRAEPAPVPKNNKADAQFKAAKDLLKLREGERGDVYLDSLGKPTAGIGHLLTEAERAKYPVGTPVPKDVIDEWFKKDSAKAFAAANRQAKEIGRPDMQAVLASVNFQLGTDWNKEHKKTWKLMKEGKWQEAAVEAANSRWFTQTPVRVKDLQDALVSR